jgi:hypothetical protein
MSPLPVSGVEASTSLAPTRSQLIEKGVVWSPSHGDTAFTVPLFDEFMRRILPGDVFIVYGTFIRKDR